MHTHTVNLKKNFKDQIQWKEIGKKAVVFEEIVKKDDSHALK